MKNILFRMVSLSRQPLWCCSAAGTGGSLFGASSGGGGGLLGATSAGTAKIYREQCIGI